MPCCSAVRGLSIVDLAPVDEDAPLVRLVEAVEDVHQRRLAGAVLAEDGMHRAARDVQADVVVGLQLAETAGYVIDDEMGVGGLHRRERACRRELRMAPRSPSARGRSEPRAGRL